MQADEPRFNKSTTTSLDFAIYKIITHQRTHGTVHLYTQKSHRKWCLLHIVLPTSTRITNSSSVGINDQCFTFQTSRFLGPLAFSSRVIFIISSIQLNIQNALCTFLFAIDYYLPATSTEHISVNIHPHLPTLSLSLTRTHTHTCLLYTSPSPRDVHKSRMPSSA